VKFDDASGRKNVVLTRPSLKTGFGASMLRKQFVPNSAQFKKGGAYEKKPLPQKMLVLRFLL
jgi:hypothetical protein